MTDEKLEIEDAVAILSGEPEHIREEIDSRQVSTDDLEHLYRAEESGKERRSVLKLLRREIKHRKVAGVLDAAREDVETLEEALEKVKELEGVETGRSGFENLDSQEIIDLMAGDVKHMQEFLEEHRPNEDSLKQLLEAEKKLNGREEAIELIEDTIERERLEVNMAEAEEDIESLEESMERLQKTSENVDPPKEDEKEGESEEQKEEPEPENDEDKTEDKEETVDEYTEGDEEPSEKEKLANELELDLTEEELESVSLEELKQVKKEKEKRENIIESLEDEGMEEDELRKASTDDLEKIKEEIEKSEEEKQAEEEKSKEEMEKEAEEDLQMLMGAGKNNEEDEDEVDETGRLESFKEKLNSGFNNEDSEEEDGSELDGKKFREVLKEYQDLGEKESIIKTAHITKGYLERELEIERELTYRELAEEIPEESEELQKLSEMFKKLNKEQYTQNISLNSEKFIETCRSAVKDLER